MLRVTITDFNDKPKEEAIKSLLDSRYVICYKDKEKKTIFCKDKSELYLTLSENLNTESTILQLYEGSVDDKGVVIFLTKEFREDN